MGHFDEVEEAWNLSDSAREYAERVGGTPSVDDYMANVFSSYPLIDMERTQREGGQPIEKIFFKNPYGLQWREQYKDWIPFRHGEIDIKNV
ncbi:hypothetical protein [Pararhodospirillum oryzae]|uniref:Uncharacterized protein n=1 Tax=Pararhodospirillum oryzae TaxID=478448 RepID=A0A512H800_9PROT|nr:hypothetical protein [Pararhodospirillum oryzae]GEO81520.1 hypothetical protein ROR02_16510 [Pararhodospirillum oryzae]